MGILFSHKNEGNPTIYNSINESRGLSASFPCSSNSKDSACNAGDPGLIPGSGRSSGEGIGNPLQYSCLENPMDRGDWWATVRGVAQSRTRLSNPTDCSPPGSSVPGILQGKNAGVGGHSLLQGIFPTQGLNSGLPQYRQIFFSLSHQRNP